MGRLELFLLGIACQIISGVVGGVPPLHGEEALFRRFIEFSDSGFTAESNFADSCSFIGLRGINENSPAVRFRLPNQIVPRNYKLEIRPILNESDVDSFTAPGVVQITVECLQATKNLVLHAAELNIDFSSVKVWQTENPSNLLVIARNNLTNLEDETYTIELVADLTVGNRYDIYIEYSARIPPPAERMNGIYQSSYLTDSNETRYIATTQFSRTRGFRKMLPSFDEPSQKAIFEISVGRQAPYHTLSNMNIRVSEPIVGKPGWTWDRYHPTPVMPPTVIAIIVSDFANQTAPPELFHPDKPISIWGPPPAMKNNAAVFSAEASAKTLKYFEDYFEITYELPKMDCAAIPDFAAGAMENWGLNTYRTYFLIWLQGVNTIAEKFRVANIIGHEFAHQYWGNLVTHAWWNDWWLTEGTASYFEYNSVHAIYPEFDALNRVLTSDTQPAMEYDIGPLSMPIHGANTTHFVEVPTTITYNKGAALVRMIQSILTEQTFKQALSHYLRKRAYTAVDQDVFFNDITEYLTANASLPSNGKTIKEIMDTWTLQTSFPLVRISQAGTNRIFVSQERYAAVENRQDATKQGGLWHVPVAYVTASNPTFNETNFQPKFWIDSGTLVTNHEVDTNQWIVVNPDGRSYYRVLYDNHFGTLLRAQLESNLESIAVGSRSMIVDDYFTSAFQWYISIDEALSMTRFIGNETDYNVWVPFMKHLRKSFEMFSSNSTEFDLFKSYILKSMEPAFAKIGFTQGNTESASWTILRVQLLDWACSMGSPGCVNEANRLISLWQADPSINPVPVDIRPFIYCAAAANSATNWQFIQQQYDATKDELIRNALACTADTTILQGLLDRAFNTSEIPVADIVPIVQRIAMNSDGRSLAMTFLETNFADVTGKIGVGGVANILTSLSSYLRTPTELTRIQTFVTDNSLGSQPTVPESLNRVSANIKWMNDFGNIIYNWLLKTA